MSYPRTSKSWYKYHWAAPPPSNFRIKEETKVEFKIEIMDGFSTEEQRALEIVENLSMPKKKKMAK